MGDGDPGGTPEGTATPPGGADTGWPPNIGLWLALLPVRAVAMLACGVVLVAGVSWTMERLLPPASNLGQSFDRLGVALAVSGVGGIALGALLTHPLGRRKLHPEARWWGSLMAVILLAVVGLFVALSS